MEHAIEKINALPGVIQKMVQTGHTQDEAKTGITCNYQSFSLIYKTKIDTVVGVLQAYSAFAEIYVDDLWVEPEHRKQGIGRALLKALEIQFKGKGYNNINLVTSQFQAIDFYKKCGFEIEFVRTNTHNPALSKTFFIKFFSDADQYQGTCKRH